MYKLSYILILVLVSVSVLGGLVDDAPPYIAVNKTQLIQVYHDFDINTNIYLISDVYLISNASITLLPYNEFNRPYFYLSSDKEEDFMYQLVETANVSIFKYGSSGVSNGNIVIDSQGVDDSDNYFMFETECNCSEDILTASATVCADLSKEVVDRNIQFLARFENGTYEKFFYGDTDLISNSVEAEHCGNVEFDKIQSTGFNMSFGFRCLDCDNSGIELYYDTNITFNGRSRKYDPVTNITTTPSQNYNIFSIVDYSNYTDEQTYENTIKFRIPYNVSIRLYKDNTTLYPLGEISPYCNQFSNLYMKSYEEEQQTSSYVKTAELINELASKIDIINIMGAYNYVSPEDNDIYFNGVYSDCKADITLYELGNYSIYLVGSKIINLEASESFTNPVTGKTTFISKITGDYPLQISTKKNYDINIFTSDWEISKTWSILNILKWVVVSLIPIVLVILTNSGLLFRRLR